MNWRGLRLKYWLEIFRTRQLNEELDQEIEAHIAIETRRRIDEGDTPEAARAGALRTFHSVAMVKEATRDTWTWAPLERLIQDLRYACRVLHRSPLFALIVVISLAVGIGANTALFSLVDAMFLRTLPVDRPDQLVFFEWTSGRNFMMGGINGNTQRDPATGELSSTSFSLLAFEKFREQTQTLSDVIAFAPMEDANLGIDGHPELISGQLVSGNYFAALRMPAFMGRTITDEDDRTLQPVAVISYGYWQRRLGSDPEVVGKAITVNGTPMTIVGVTAPDFVGALGFGEHVDVSIPLSLEEQFRPNQSDRSLPRYWWLRVMGRLKPAVQLEQVRGELEGVLHGAALESWETEQRLFPVVNAGAASRVLPMLRVLPGSRGITDNTRDSTGILLPLGATSTILLLIVCVNVANLLLARGAARQREIGVRLALGAGRARVIRQLLTETILLFIAGGAVGVVFAFWGRDLVTGLLSANDSTVFDLRIDFRVLGFTAAVSLLTGLLFGCAPAFRAARNNIGTTIKEHNRSLLRTRNRLRMTLLVAQVALSIVLLVGAGLLVRTVRNLQAVDFGFDRSNLLLFQISPGTLKYNNGRIARLYEQTQEAVAALPGVVSATSSSFPMVSGSGTTRRIVVQGIELSDPAQTARVLTVRANFFESLGIPILVGRALTPRDTETGAPVALINETFARVVFGNINPVGARFGFGTADHSGDIEIIGVVKDVGISRPRDPLPQAVFLPDLQGITPYATFTVRTAGDPLLLAGSVREVVRLIDPNLPVFDVKTQEQQVEQAFATERTFAIALTFFGGTALVLACIGLFGLMSYNVERRTSEIGLRIALGARTFDVVQLIMRQSLGLVFIGVLLGIPSALAATRLVRRLLFNVAPTDPLTIGIAIATMIVVACFATYLPARRASRVDPTSALRAE